MKIFESVKHTLLNTKLDKVQSFFDYSAREKSRIIKQAVRESNKMQKELIERYERQLAA